MWFVAFAVTAVINRNDLPARLGQKVDPAGRLPVNPGIGSKPVDQQYGFAFALHLIGNVDIV